jgi:hypothetical protein
MPVSMAVDIPFEAAYPVVAWLCWVPNLVVAEVVLRTPWHRQASTVKLSGTGSIS